MGCRSSMELVLEMGPAPGGLQDVPIPWCAAAIYNPLGALGLSSAAPSPAAAPTLTSAFLLLQHPKKQAPNAEDLTSDSVQSISINTLFLLSTTVDRMSNVSLLSP